MAEKKKKWLGTPPKQCDVCGSKITMEFVDGKTTLGPWANLCMTCHEAVGVGLGTGRGQHYYLTVDEDNVQFQKVSG